MKFRVYVLLSIVLAGLSLLACDLGSAGDLIAFSKAPATPTKTPRPTFTPRPSLTPTPADTDTPVPTDTPQVPATATKKPVPTSRPRPVATKPPPPPPAPSFPVTVSDTYYCPQPQTSFWEVIARINRSTPPRIFLGGYALAAYSLDGHLLGTSSEAVPDGQQVTAFDFNCKVSGWYAYNLKMDVTEFRGTLPIVFRVVRSKTDLTPVSPDFKADFPEPGRYFLEYNAPQ